MSLLSAIHNGHVKIITFAGGPSSGKSTTLEAMQTSFGNNVMVLPEEATLRIAAGYTPPGEHEATEAKMDWARGLQRMVLVSQIVTLEEYVRRAAKRGIRVLLCDRGFPDALVYLSTEEAQGLLRAQGLSLEDAFAIYHNLIYFESLAMSMTEQDYAVLQNNNPTRVESYHRAREVEQKTRTVWEQHPRKVLVFEGERQAQDQVVQVRDFIQTLL